MSANLPSSRPRHSHIVALPLAVAIFAFSIADAHTGITASVSDSLRASSSDERFSRDSGVYGIGYEGAAIEWGEDAVIRKGSVLLASDGLVQAHAGPYSISSFDGAMYVANGTSSVTVAAITAPVFITSGEGRVIIPVGMQWEGSDMISPFWEGFSQWTIDRIPTGIPSHFLTRILGDLSVLDKPVVYLPVQKSLLPVDIIPDEHVLLPVSRRNALQERREHILGVVRRAVELNDTAQFEELLRDETVLDAAASHRGLNVLPHFLSAVPAEDTPMRMLLMRVMALDERLWMIGSFHPKYRDITWAVPDPDVSADAHLTRAFVFPFSLFRGPPPSDFVYHRFTLAIKATSEQPGDTESFMEHAVVAHYPLVEMLKEHGYPGRAAFLAALLEDRILGFKKPTQKLRNIRQALRRREDVAISPLPPKVHDVPHETYQEQEIKQPEQIFVMPPQQAVSLARRLLERAEALFSVRTKISPAGDNAVRVSGIVFGSSSGDRTASFTLDVASETVSDISVNGNANFPYQPTFAEFVRGVRQ